MADEADNFIEQPAQRGRLAGLHAAGKAKNDESYTQWIDIEKKQNLEYGKYGSIPCCRVE